MTDNKEKDLIDDIDTSNQTGLGCHVWKVEEYKNHADIAIKHYMSRIPKMGAWQIFSHGPRSQKLVQQDDPNKLYQLAKKIPLFIHSSYLTSPSNDNLSHFIDQMISAREYGAQGLIIHIPKATIIEIIEMTNNMINAIKNNDYFRQIIDKNKNKFNKGKFNMPIIPRIIWEAKALKQCPESFETPEKWNNLAIALKESGLNPDTIGLNIDTAHIYASGANISTDKEAILWLSGLSPLTMTYMKSGLLHLNGNNYHHDIRAGDKHCIPGSTESPEFDDKIWEKEKDITNSGCSEFIKWARINSIPIILELKHDELRIDNIAKFANKFN